MPTWHHVRSHPVEHCQEGVEGVEVGLDGVLPVDLQLETAAEELEDHCEELVPAAHVLHMRQPAQGEDTSLIKLGWVSLVVHSVSGGLDVGPANPHYPPQSE